MKLLFLCCLSVGWPVYLTSASPSTWCTFAARAPNPDCLAVAADPNSVPWGIDPNQIAGILLPFVQAPAGKWVYTLRACDAEGDPFTVTLEQGPPGFGLTGDDPNGLVTLSGELPAGPNLFYLRAYDQPGVTATPMENIYTLPVYGIERANTAPVLYPGDSP